MSGSLGGYDVITETLIIFGDASIKARNKNGATALDEAAYHGHIEVLKAICANSGPDFEDLGGQPTTPPHQAAAGNQVATINWLTQPGCDCDVNMVDADGHQPLHLAVIKALLNLGADVHQASPYEGPLLTIALRRGNWWLVPILLQHGADINQKFQGDSPLHWAVRFGTADLVRLLLVQEGIDVDVRDDEGNSPLDLAREVREDEPTIVLLLEQHSETG